MSTVDLILTGDLMLGRGVNLVVRARGPGYPLHELEAQLATGDLRLTNLECAISAHEGTFSGEPRRFYFRADPAGADVLTRAGIEGVNLANNHALDADHRGLRDTLDVLDAHGIARAGAGRDRTDARRPAIVQVDGTSVGWIGFCDHAAEYAAGADRPGTAYVDLTSVEDRRRVLEIVGALADQVDHAVVAAHWQANWAPHVKPRFRRFGRELLERGARVVWGHSPHHFQGVERTGDGTILYSTGDFLDDYAVDPEFRNDRQLLFRVRLGASAVDAVDVFPIQLDVGRTAPADLETRRWIRTRFEAACRETGTRVEDGENGWWTVR